MPDRDEFAKHLQPQWRRFARWVFADHLSPEAVRQVGWQACKDLKRMGDFGLSEICDLLDQADAGTGNFDDMSFISHLGRITVRSEGTATELFVRRFKQLLMGDDLLTGTIDLATERRAAVQEVIRSSVIDYVMQQACPPVVITERVRSGEWKIDEAYGRVHELRQALVDSDVIARLTAELYDDPTGESITIPRQRNKKVSQQELLETSLSDI